MARFYFNQLEPRPKAVKHLLMCILPFLFLIYKGFLWHPQGCARLPATLDQDAVLDCILVESLIPDGSVTRARAHTTHTHVRPRERARTLRSRSESRK